MRETIYGLLKIGLASGGPIAAIVMRYTNMSQRDWELWAQLILFIGAPALAYFFDRWQNTPGNKGAALARLPLDEQIAAMRPMADAAKVASAGQVEDVEKVLVKKSATDDMAEIVASSDHPKVVGL